MSLDQRGGYLTHLLNGATRAVHPLTDPALVFFIEKLKVPCLKQRSGHTKIEIGFNGVRDTSRGALELGVFLKGEIPPQERTHGVADEKVIVTFERESNCIETSEALGAPAFPHCFAIFRPIGL